eukprot:685608-Rhodomonas_salina.1
MQVQNVGFKRSAAPEKKKNEVARRAAAVCLRRKGRCAPDGRAGIRDVRSRYKDVPGNPCCTVRRLESEAFVRRDHTVVCVSRTSRLRHREGQMFNQCEVS